jgi:small-conductance mechanosensitive channel
MTEKLLEYLSIGSGTNFWQYNFLGNTVVEYIDAVVMFLIFLIVFKLFQTIVLYKLNKFAEKTKTDIDDTFIKIVKTLKPPFYSFLAFYMAIKFLVIENLADKIIGYLLIAWVIYQGVIAVQILIDYILFRQLKGKEDPHTKSAMRLMGNIAKGILWVIGILMFLSNLGIDITSLIAGLGIGGIAIALALQNVLGDLFSSFAIYLDKPFAVGDFVILGTDMGTVEKIGIKTTRIRTLRGEELVVSNNELTQTRIQNFKQMKERRITFNFGITYSTPTEKVKRIPGIVEKIIKEEKLTRFDRAHFNSFGDSALMFDIVYYINSSEYIDYANAQQRINLKLKELFEKEGIEFAYPTQTIILDK